MIWPFASTGVRDEDRIAHQSCDAFRDAGFAVAGVAEEEDGCAELIAGPDLAERFVGDDEVFKRLANAPPRNDESLDGLGHHRFDVIGEGDRHGADVGGFVERVAECVFTFRRLDCVNEAGVAAVAFLRNDVDERLLSHRLEDGIHDREGYRHCGSKFAAGDIASRINRAERQFKQKGQFEPEVFPAWPASAARRRCR